MASGAQTTVVAGIWTQTFVWDDALDGLAPAVLAALGDAAFSCVVVVAKWPLPVARVCEAIAQTGRAAHVIGGTVVDFLHATDYGEAHMVSVMALDPALGQLTVGQANAELGPIAAAKAAVADAANQAGLAVADLDERHVALTVFDGVSGHEEAFCLGTAMQLPRGHVVGGALAMPDFRLKPRAQIWHHGWQRNALGIVILLRSNRKFAPISAVHVEPTEIRTVVTHCVGKQIIELDGQPADVRFRELLAQIDAAAVPDATSHPFGWFSRNKTYLRSVIAIEPGYLQLAGTTTRGQVLRVMRPTDMVAALQAELDTLTAQLGQIQAWLLFSCIERQDEARQGQCLAQLLAAYHAVPCFGFESFGEQSGMMLVNHTLTGIAFGAPF